MHTHLQRMIIIYSTTYHIGLGIRSKAKSIVKPTEMHQLHFFLK